MPRLTSSTGRQRGPTVSTVQVPVLPQDQALTGTNANIWATAILRQMNAPVNNANVSSLLGWFHNEGGGGANNPMNTTLRASGSTSLPGNPDGVQEYLTPSQGVKATVDTLSSGYPAIVASLRAGHGLANATGPVASELGTWSGGGYHSITPIQPTNGLFTGPLASPGQNAGRTRPGGQQASQQGSGGQSGGSGSSGKASQVLGAYVKLRDTQRTAPPGTTNPFRWWWSSFTNNWNNFGGGGA